MCLYSLIFQTVSVCAFCAVWGTQVLQAGNRCFPGFCGFFLFCSFSGVILYPESAWRSSPPSPPAPLAGTHSGAVRLHAPLPVPRLWTEGARRNTSPQTLADKVCRRVSKYKLTNHSLSLIILGIEVGTEKCWAHMIKNISKYPAWHR